MRHLLHKRVASYGPLSVPCECKTSTLLSNCLAYFQASFIIICAKVAQSNLQKVSCYDGSPMETKFGSFCLYFTFSLFETYLKKTFHRRLYWAKMLRKGKEVEKILHEN